MKSHQLCNSLHPSFAVYTPRMPIPQSQLPDQPRHAIIAFQLHSLSRISPNSRISRQSLLLTRTGLLDHGLLGADSALELRYIVNPARETNGWNESIACYLILRLTRANLSAAALRSKIAEQGKEIATLLESSISEYCFEPVEELQVLKSVLVPFPVRDTFEVRRRTFPVPGGGMISLPWQGVVDIESVLDVMLRQPAATALALCVCPCQMSTDIYLRENDGRGTAALRGGEGNERIPLALESYYPGAQLDSVLAGDQDATVAQDSAASVYPEVWQQLYLRQSLALRMASFHLRVQATSAGEIGESLLATLTREVGGPGRLTAEAAWQAPMLPLAGGAVWSRPRSARTRGNRESEFATACSNFSTLDFAPWGECRRLAHLGEAACTFALPEVGHWLPQQSVAVALPFRAPVKDGVKLGVSKVRGGERQVCLPLSNRRHHLWIAGQTGTGKSTLLETIVLQDMLERRGVIVIDPHGDLIHQLLGKIPRDRLEDVILFDPADKSRPLGLNPLESSSEDEQDLLVNAFIDLLIKLYDPHHMGVIGPRFEHGARNVMLTVMSTPGNTLVEVLRAFQDDAFVKKHLLPNVTDPLVHRYWTDQISQTNSFHRSEVLDWLVSKFSHFVTDRTMRRILGQSTSSFSFREAMDSGKIVLLSLAKGMLGSENATFLGLIVLPMILRAALSRAELPEADRRDVSLVIDEFHNYATDSLALMLAEARKYHIGLTLANQHTGQLTAEIREAVLGNVGSTLAFRLGTTDAVAMEAMLAPSPISAAQLVTLPNFTAYGRLLIGEQRTPVFTLKTELSPIEYDLECAREVSEYSRMRYGRPREDIDAEIASRSKLQS
jgi:hypothetical protein